MENGCASRSVNSPATWSTSPLVKTTLQIGLSRFPLRGSNADVLLICWRRSGDALNNIHCRSSADTAMEDWVLAGAAGSPPLALFDAGSLLFHWGKPPPAADPMTINRSMIGPETLRPGPPQLFRTIRRRPVRTKTKAEARS